MKGIDQKILVAVHDTAFTGAQIAALINIDADTSLAARLTSLYKRKLIGCVSMAPITWLATDAGRAALAAADHVDLVKS